MKKLVVIDMQNEFVDNNIKNSILDINSLIIKNEYDDIIFTRFINDRQSLIYTTLNYKGCLTPERQKLVVETKQYKVIDKNTYSAFEKIKKYLTTEDKIYLCGIDIDCCVLLTALNLFENNYDVYVLEDYVYCRHGEKSKMAALEILKTNMGKDRIIKESD